MKKEITRKIANICKNNFKRKELEKRKEAVHVFSEIETSRI